MVRTLTALILMGTLTSSALDAQPIDRSSRPATEAIDVTPFPAYNSFTLSNGLTVYHVPDPRPTVTLRLMIPGGSAADGVLPGRAEFVADLLTKGSGDLSAQEFAASIDFLGGSISGSAAEEYIAVGASGLKTRFESILELFSAAVADPSFDQDEFAKYRAMSVEGLKAAKGEASFLAEAAIARLTYGESSPLGAMPTEELMMAIEQDDLVEYHEEYFTPKGSILAVVGSYDKDELQAMLERHLGSWRGPEDVVIPQETYRHEGRRVILIDRPTSVQSAIRIVGPGPFPNDMDRTRARIVGDIIGGGTGLGNRLTMNLRETHGWTYSPRAYFTSNRYVGSFLASADVAGEVTDSAVKEMLFEIERMTTEPVGADELNLNINSAVGTYLMSLARPNVTARRVQSIDFYDMESDYYDRLVERYQSTTVGEIQRLAKKYFRQEDMSIIVVGRATEIGNSLDQFGPVERWDSDLNPVNQVSAEDLQITAEEIWANVLEALGGVEALQGVRSIEATGTLTMSMGPQSVGGTFSAAQRYPADDYLGLTISVAGQSMTVFERFVSASDIVQKSQGKIVPVPEEMKDTIRAGSHINMMAWLDQLGGTLELNGMEDVGGASAYIITVTLPNLKPFVYTIDAQSFLPLSRADEGGLIEYHGWMAVEGGSLQPSGFVLTTMGQRIEVTAMSYVVNQDLPDTRFQPGK